jgi:molecular chaperone GrpE
MRMEQIMTDCETPMEQEQTPETLAPDTEHLHARIAELEQAYEEQKNLYLRTLADFQNYRRRQHEEIERQRGLLLESVMTELLPILDNFERALQAAEATRELEPLIEGVAHDRATGQSRAGAL